MNRWLITGGCGFIGAALIRRLLETPGNAVRVVDNLSTGTRDDLVEVCAFTEPVAGSFFREWSGVQLLVGDILDEELAVQAACGADVIVHLAANTGVPTSVEHPRRDMRTNVIGTFNYLEAARHQGCPSFVFASSGATVGECTPPIHEAMPSLPVSPYGASKLAGEGYCSAYSRAYGLSAVSLRFGNVYGPGSARKTSVVAKFLKNAAAGEPLVICGDGTQTRDFIHIDDIVSAIMAAANAPGVAGEVFQIATSREHSVREMADMLVALLVERGMGPVRLEHGEGRAGDVMRNFSDTSKARRMLGWQPAYTLRQGLETTIDWFAALHARQCRKATDAASGSDGR